MSTTKVACRECGKRFFVLVDHLKTRHQMTPLEYMTKHGGWTDAPLWSPVGERKLRELNTTKVSHEPRPRKEVPFKSLFPTFGAKDGIEYDGNIQIFATPDAKLTPKLNPHYRFPEEQTMDLLACIEKPERNRIYIQGWSGTGKTELVRNLAAKVGAPLMVINGDAFLQRSHFVGTPWVENGEMRFKKGPLIRAMEHGYWLLINEYDTLSPDVVNLFKPTMEDPAYLPVPELEDDAVIYAVPDFRLLVTANTGGRGDDSGLFSQNTHIQSDADMRRFNVRLRVDYMPREDEIAMLMSYFDGRISQKEAETFVDTVGNVRSAFKAGTIGKTFSPAELICWVENWLICAKTPHHAARITFLNALPDTDAHAISEMVNAKFGIESSLKAS
jgi:cobaltochelatase CobS